MWLEKESSSLSSKGTQGQIVKGLTGQERFGVYSV